MGKILKYCSSCDEGFAAKFAFCPDCGQPLEAFEMNPVVQDAPPAVEAAPTLAEGAPPVVEAAPAAIVAPVAGASESADLLEVPAETAAPETVIEPVEEPIIEVAAEPFEPIVEPVIEPAVPEVAETSASASIPAATAANVFFQSTPVDVDRKPASLEAEHEAYSSDGDFYVTVIEEKNVKQRNRLLLGSLVFVMFTLMTSLVYNIFSMDLDVGAINEDTFIASLLDDVPMAVEEEQQQKRDKSAGGGGGGGREEEETTQGDLANQTKNPERPPQAVPRLDDPLRLPPASTQGNKTFDQTHDRYGDPNARFQNWNNGTGSGGGQGSGTGTGQGSGRGTGAGSGIGSGYGGGIGDGNGNGRGSGEDGAPPPARSTVTQALAITGKPRPGYTDSARQANIQGTVILRVTFLGSGQIGSISPVKGLPNGLTEQAIAAARRISFKPKMVDGVPQSVTKQIEYTFSIY